MLAFEIGEKIVDKLFEIGEEAINAAAAAERMDLAFKLSLGQEGGAEMVEWLEKITGKTEFADDQLKGWGKELLNAGVAAEELDKFMAAGLDVAAKSPDKMEGMSKAISALSKASLTGAVDMRSLRGLSIGIEQLKTLPKFAHMSVKQLKKEMTDGKLTKEDLLSVIAGPDKILGDLGIQAGKTLQARLLHLRHIPEEIFQKLAKTQAFDRLSAAIGGALEKLDPDGPFGKKVFGGIERMFDKFATLVEQIDFDALADTITDDVIPAIEKLFGWMAKMVTATERIIHGFHVMSEIPGLITGEGGKKTAAVATKAVFGKSREELDKEGVFSRFADGVTSGLKHVAGMVTGQHYNAGKQAGAGMEKGLKDSVPGVGAAAGDVAAAAPKAARKELKVQSPSVVFEDIGAMTAAGFVEGLRGSRDDVSDAMDAAFKLPMIPRTRPSAGGGGGGGTTISIGHIDVHVGGHATEADGAAAARGFAQELRPALIDLLEQVQLGEGA